ncbi:hypothetical protein J4406_01920 [Candidatus Woesearchaeota archaeon]|nr:hypothetical protein [Candidatus Woesearchaeota archaeon]
MKDFKIFLEDGSIKRITPNKSLIKSLVNDAIKRLDFYKKLRLDNENSKYILENIYESLRELADAVLIKDGYKSYSHEASITYLLKYNLPLVEINKFDNFRKIRNNSKYYGKPVDLEDSKEIMELAEKLLKDIKNILKDANS